MPDSTLTQVITAVASVFMALSVVIGALTLFLPVLRRVKEANALAVVAIEKTTENNVLTISAIEKVDEVHHIVNQQRTDAMNYQRALIRALEAHGVSVPVDQSVEQPQSKGVVGGQAVTRIEKAVASVEAVANGLTSAIEDHNVDEASHTHEDGTSHPRHVAPPAAP